MEQCRFKIGDIIAEDHGDSSTVTKVLVVDVIRPDLCLVENHEYQDEDGQPEVIQWSVYQGVYAKRQWLAPPCVVEPCSQCGGIEWPSRKGETLGIEIDLTPDGT